MLLGFLVFFFFFFFYWEWDTVLQSENQLSVIEIPSLCLDFFHLLARKPNLEKKNSIYSNKLFHNFYICCPVVHRSWHFQQNSLLLYQQAGMVTPKFLSAWINHIHKILNNWKFIWTFCLWLFVLWLCVLHSICTPIKSQIFKNVTFCPMKLEFYSKKSNIIFINYKLWHFVLFVESSQLWLFVLWLSVLHSCNSS